MALNKIFSRLKDDGWKVREKYLSDIENQSMSYEALVKLLMNTDIKEYGTSSLASDTVKGKLTSIEVPVVLQVSNIRNVSAPKANEESTTAPRMLKVTLTDGTNFVHGLEVNSIKAISLKTAPGTKVKLISKIVVSGGYLMLSQNNIELVGGTVEEMYQKWKLSQSVSKYSRCFVASDGSGPPPWVPFGEKIQVEQERNFKALADSASKKKEDNGFEHQRQKVVSELNKDASQKVFGGGKQMLDSSVQKIINYGGFTIEEAEWALRKNKNDVQKAIQELKWTRLGGEEGSQNKSYNPPVERGRGRGGLRGRGRGGRGRDNRGPDGSDEDIPMSASARPSGPASLLDYLESRILSKTGEVPEPPPSQEDTQSFRSNRGRRGRGDQKQQKSSPVPEPSFSVENWPSLGEEPNVAVEPKHQGSNNFIGEQHLGSSDNDHHSQFEGGQPNQTGHKEQNAQLKNNQAKFNNSQQSHKENQSTYGKDSLYRENTYSYRKKVPSYKENFSNEQDSSYNHRGNSPSFRGSYSNYNNSSNYVNGPPVYCKDSSSYREPPSRYGENRADYSGIGANYYAGSANYKENAAPYKNSKYRGNSNYGDNYHDRSAYYNQSNNSQSYARDSLQQRPYRNDSSKYDQAEDYSSRQRKSEQVHYTRGMGRQMERANSVNLSGNYSRGAQHHDYSNGNKQLYGQDSSTDGFCGGEGANRNYSREGTRIHTPKERELIAMFEKSMVMGGFYETPTYESQNRASHPQSANPGYTNSYNNYQDFSGSYEYHRGGDGYARKSTGGDGRH